MKTNSQGVLAQKKGMAREVCIAIIDFLKKQRNEKNNDWVRSIDLWESLSNHNPQTISRQLNDLETTQIIEKISFIPEPTRRSNKRGKTAVFYRISLAYFHGLESIQENITRDQIVIKYGELRLSFHAEGERLLTAINLLEKIEESNPEIFVKLGISDIPGEIGNSIPDVIKNGLARMKYKHDQSREIGISAIGETADLEKPILARMVAERAVRRKTEIKECEADFVVNKKKKVIKTHPKNFY